MILEAMKGAFDNVNHIHEQCEILDIFYSMSERSRVKSAYYQRADTVTSMLKEELARLMHGTSTRYRVTLTGSGTFSACGSLHRIYLFL